MSYRSERVPRSPMAAFVAADALPGLPIINSGGPAGQE